MVCDMIHVKSHDMTCAIYMLRLQLFQDHMSLSDRVKDGGISACVGFANGERLMVECVMVALGIADMEKVAPVTAGVINTQKEEDPHRTPKMKPLQELEATYANFWEYALTELSKTPSGRLGCGHPARNLRQSRCSWPTYNLDETELTALRLREQAMDRYTIAFLSCKKQSRCSWPTYDLDETELAALRLREQAVERYTIAILSRKVRFSLFPSLERGTTGRKGNKTSIRRAYSKKKSILSWPAHVLQDRLAENLILQATQAFQLRRADVLAWKKRSREPGILSWPIPELQDRLAEDITLQVQLRRAEVLALSTWLWKFSNRSCKRSGDLLLLKWQTQRLAARQVEDILLLATQAFQLRRAEMQASQLRRAVRGGNLLLLKWPTARRVAASQVEEILLRAMQAFQLRKAKVLASSNLKIVEL